MPKEELDKFLRIFYKDVIVRELQAANVPQEVIDAYELHLTDEDYKKLQQSMENFLMNW